MVAILIENSYAHSLWCEKIHLALVERLRAKRIAFCEIYSASAFDLIFSQRILKQNDATAPPAMHPR